MDVDVLVSLAALVAAGVFFYVMILKTNWNYFPKSVTTMPTIAATTESTPARIVTL